MEERDVFKINDGGGDDDETALEMVNMGLQV